ncbi:MAG: hypothetical protein ACLGG8_09110 [Gammaproteobacteria bacterium]
MKATLASLALAGTALLGTGTASAQELSWSVTIGSPGYGGVPTVVMPPPRVVHAPRIIHAPTVIHAPPRVVYSAPRYVVHPAHAHPRGPHWRAGKHHRQGGKKHWKHHRHGWD